MVYIKCNASVFKGVTAGHETDTASSYTPYFISYIRERTLQVFELYSPLVIRLANCILLGVFKIQKQMSMN